MKSLRILSLLPAATEIVYLLGLEQYLIGVSHECDYPVQVKKKSKVTFSGISNIMSSREIDDKVKKTGHRGPGINHIKEGVLKKLRPNLILTQELCEVCAPTPSVILSDSEGSKLYSSAAPQNDNLKIVSLEPESMEDILENIRVVGEVGGKEKEAARVVRGLRNRLDNVSSRLANARSNNKLRVLVIEWLDPIMIAGHWVPQMIKLAGGEHLGTKKGERSKKLTIKQLQQFNIDILIISPCGFDIKRVYKEKRLIKSVIRGIGDIRDGVYLVDGNAYMTRPGPRIINGIEILSEILHPDPPVGGPRKYSEKDWIRLE